MLHTVNEFEYTFCQLIYHRPILPADPIKRPLCVSLPDFKKLIVSESNIGKKYPPIYLLHLLLVKQVHFTHDIYMRNLRLINHSPLYSLFLSPVTEEWVANFFSCLNDKKSFLDVPNKLVRLASKSTLSEPFAYIFNKSISTGIVHDVFKVSKVTPIFKNGTLSDPSNYRPITTLSLFSKSLERIIYDQLIQYLDKHDVLFKYQFSFRKNHSMH